MGIYVESRTRPSDILLVHLYDIPGGLQLSRRLVGPTRLTAIKNWALIEALPKNSYTTYASSALAGQSLLREFAEPSNDIALAANAHPSQEI